MTEGIVECPYCGKDCELDDWHLTGEGDENESECVSCGKTFLWNWEFGAPVFTSEMLY